VAKYNGQRHRQVALHHMQITVTNTRRLHPDQDLTRTRLSHMDFLYNKRLARLIKNCGK
jgi:hypothetical protein